ncbi:unnamed protein product [Adineta ricciae]|uniref:BTB domain-containing protein n=1 Tax=Adineta ricciae TaxID=249248 RepID=A0A814GLH8_ADIRI|nr:unnamed protein product [Adineta ricciae]
MHSTQRTETIEQVPNEHEPPPTHQRRTLDRLFEKTISVKVPNRTATNKDTYISDIVNVQSLLNIRSTEYVSRKRFSSNSFQDRVIINVCGDRYETYRSTLELYPNTLLGNRKRRKYFYDKIRNEYFFDRNRACFEAILYYYQSHGRLRRPNYVPIDIFLEEVTFFQLGQVAVDQLRKDENIKEVKKIHLPKNRFRRHLWATMEYPDYSNLAKFVNILSLFMILTSTIGLAVESLPQYIDMETISCERRKQSLTTPIYSNETNDTSRTSVYCDSYFSTPFFYVQTVCVAFFTIELILRLISTPSLITYIKSIMNWVDILAVIPYYVSVIVHLVGQSNDAYTATYTALRLLRIIRFVRIFKFYRVFRNIKSLRVLTSTVKQSIPDFLIMITILTLLSFLFGSATYFAETDTNGAAFDSILKATYWGVITITSVGYGDIYPITPLGRVIACLCSLFGAATIGMLVSVLVDRYQRVYARKLYINDEIVKFEDLSEDENNDHVSRTNSWRHRQQNQTKDIENPDARAMENAAFEEENNRPSVPDIIVSTSVEENVKDIIPRNNSRVHFIIGYVDDDKHAASLDLLETIGSVVAQKQATGENIQLNIMQDKPPQSPQRTSPYDVKFRISPSSTDDSDEEEELTEIITGCSSKGGVLKKFQAPPSPSDEKS